MHRDSEKSIDRWVNKIDSSEIVLVIGAGFSKNAVDSSGRSANNRIPDLKELVKPFLNEFSVSETDAQLTLDYIKKHDVSKYERELLRYFVTETHKRGDLRYQKYKPGNAHKALSKLGGIKAIITTNCLDMLLEQDNLFEDFRCVIEDKDIPNKPEKGLDILYLHGHQSRPDTWILTKSEYEGFENNPLLKFGYALHLLSMYPSVFVGFSFKDENVNRLLTFISEKLRDYRPGRLSIVVEQPDPVIAERWRDLGVETVCIDQGKDSSIQKDVAITETIEHFVACRNRDLIRSGVLLPGIRTGSYHRDLVKELGNCKMNDKDILKYCNYHSSRRDGIIVRIPLDDKVRITNTLSVKFDKDSPAHNVMQRLKNKEHIAGSWGLMPQHATWLKKHYSAYTNDMSEVSVLITGIAGLPHFVDTVSLLFEANPATKIKLYVVDKCEGPLFDIKQFRDKNIRLNSIGSDAEYYDVVRRMIDEDMLKVDCKTPMNILDEQALSILSELHNQIDIVLSHKIASFLNLENDDSLDAYAGFVSTLLKEDGILISAQNVFNGVAKKIIHLNSKMRVPHNLNAINVEPSFDVYDQPIDSSDLDKNVYDAIRETLLSVHRKHEYPELE